MRTFWLDLRYAARILRQNPAFALVAILVLALGIGATTAMFSVVDAALLRPLPYPSPERLMWVSVTFPKFRTEWMLGPDYIEWQQQNHVFENFTAFDSDSCDLSGGREPVRLHCGTVSQTFFATFGVAPLLGRAFLPAEDQPGGAKAIILAHGLWQQQFGADPKVLGCTVILDGAARTVVGVMPDAFRFPGALKVDALIPMQLDVASELRRDAMLVLQTAGRLKPGMTALQARADLEVLLANNRRRFPQYYQKGNQVRVVSLADHQTGATRLTLWVLLAAGGCVLLVAMVNIANLLLARAAGRQREIAVRMALGAGRWRLARQFLTESALVAVLGGLGGLFTAFAAMKAILPIAPEWVPREASLDARLLAFATAISILTGLLFGAAPAFFAGRTNLNEALKTGAFRAGGAAGGRLRAALVVVELALSLVLVTGASLLLESLWRLQTVPLGFEPEHVVTARIARHAAERSAFWQELLEKIRRLPGVEAVALAKGLPPEARTMDAPFDREGHPSPATPRPADTVVGRQVSPGYFRAMGIPQRQGRPFDDQDAPGHPEPCIVNETLVRRFFPGENPLGQHIMGYNNKDWKTIVGVVADAKNAGLRGNPQPEIYEPYTWAGDRGRESFDLLVRSRLRPAALAPLLRETIRTLDRTTPLAFRTVADNLAGLTVQPRFSAFLLTIFAGAALMLAAVGTYGVLSYSVTQRTQEIGIRMALGATAVSVVRIVVGHALRLAATGIAIGLALAFALTRYLGSLLFEARPTDPLTFAGVCLLLTATALLASWIPGRRATHVDPVRALRCD